jgi:hypothetical protein
MKQREKPFVKHKSTRPQSLRNPRQQAGINKQETRSNSNSNTTTRAVAYTIMCLCMSAARREKERTSSGWTSCSTGPELGLSMQGDGSDEAGLNVKHWFIGPVVVALLT